MTNKKILIATLGKAITKGCPCNFIKIDYDQWFKHKFYYSAIFDIKFAKAFW